MYLVFSRIFVVFLTVLKEFGIRDVLILDLYLTHKKNFGFGNTKFKVFKLGEVLTHDLGSLTKPRFIPSHGKLLYHVLIFMGLRFVKLLVLDEMHLL